MVHPADDFGSHIARRATSLLTVVLFPFPGNPKISDSGISIFLKHYVFGLEVAMDDIAGVDVFQGQYDTADNEF